MRVPNLPVDHLRGRARSFGILGSYPPTACGLATFTAALASGLSAHDAQVGVVRVVDVGGKTAESERVIGELVNGSATSLIASSDLLNKFDVAVVHHEYGLYGGTDGDDVLEILGGLRVPSIVIAHTILTNPTPHQRSVLNEVAALADHVVVMSEAARARLCDGFDVDHLKVSIIAHGAAIPTRRVVPERAGRPLILTWGLIGPGKGIERAIAAMPALMDLPMRPRYLVAGQTHPKVLAAHGESYRQDRIEQAERLGISSSVDFDAGYRDVTLLTALIQSSKVVVLPYDSKEQVTSGVLVDAIAAGRPVVATAFPHAVELLATGAGVVVDHDDPDAMARRAEEDPHQTGAGRQDGRRSVPARAEPRMARCCRRIPRLGQWSPRPATCAGVNSSFEAPEPDFGHLVSMTDAHGTFEHALFSEPRPEHGYCSDDMARVLVVATREQRPARAMRNLAMVSLSFLQDALDSQGRCRNRMNCSGTWEDSPALDDCWGRTIWGLGTAASHSDDHLVRHLASRGLERAMRQRSPWPRAMAFAALGAAEVLSVDPDNTSARALVSDAADAMSKPVPRAAWPWPEQRLTYANATLPEAMIAAGTALERPALVRRGLDLLGWLFDRETRQGHLSVTPVGGSGPDDHGPAFDQQPIEVAALADACARAQVVDGDRRWTDGVTAAADWFLGDNDAGVLMWDPSTGGGFDGLQSDSANLNQGTESTLALLSTMQHAQSFLSVLQ